MNKTLSIRPTRGNENLVPDLRTLAKADNRNLNNYLETVLMAHVQANRVKLASLRHRQEEVNYPPTKR